LTRKSAAAYCESDKSHKEGASMAALPFYKGGLEQMNGNYARREPMGRPLDTALPAAERPDTQELYIEIHDSVLAFDALAALAEPIPSRNGRPEKSLGHLPSHVVHVQFV
jgi:hypothetical protein